MIYTGFIAQDVEKAAKELNYDFSGVDAAKNSKDLYGLRYSEFVVPLVKAVQELSKMNDDKDAQIAQLNERLTKLENAISQNTTSSNNTAQSQVVTVASLKQNIPNPFNSTTVINYQLPQHTSVASLKITGANGQLIKIISLSDASGRVVFQAGQLAAGIYQYTLIADGKMIDSKKMIITK